MKSLKFKVKSCPQNAAELLVQSIRFKVQMLKENLLNLPNLLEENINKTVSV